VGPLDRRVSLAWTTTIRRNASGESAPAGLQILREHENEIFKERISQVVHEGVRNAAAYLISIEAGWILPWPPLM